MSLPPSPRCKTALAPFALVKQHLMGELSLGRWPPGTLMPSEAALVAQFGVSRMTVNRALRELQTQGFIDRVQGVGTFAAQAHRMSSTLTVRDLHEEIEARGHHHHAVVHLVRQEQATLGLAQQLGLAEGAPVYHSLIVHHDNGQPLQCEDRYVNPAWSPDYLSVDFSQITPTQHLLEVAPWWDAQYTIEASTATVQEAALLGIAATDPCLVLVRRTISRGVPVTLARLVHPGGRYQLEGAFSR